MHFYFWSKTAQLPEPFRSLADSANALFEDAMDFTWKAPEFIELQKKTEFDKLENYYPYTGDEEKDREARRSRISRAALELPKLTRSFPRFLYVGVFLSNIALYEQLCLKLVEVVAAHKGGEVSKYAGLSHIFDWLSKNGVPQKNCCEYRAIDYAIKFRNCLIHASGVLAASRSENEIRAAIADLSYVPSRYHGSEDDEHFPRVSIISGQWGDQLSIGHWFVWASCVSLRDHFISMCFLASGEEWLGHE